jgi:hypothetical protein
VLILQAAPFPCGIDCRSGVRVRVGPHDGPPEREARPNHRPPASTG